MKTTQTTKWASKALNTGWHEFVCLYVAHKTARKEAHGYRLRRAGEQWELLLVGTPVFAPMSASTAYSWFIRTMGLCGIAREADELRIKAHMDKQAA